VEAEEERGQEECAIPVERKHREGPWRAYQDLVISCSHHERVINKGKV
jgi:hypothetical protein